MNTLLNYLAHNPDSTGLQLLQHVNISPDEVRKFFTITAERISQMSDQELIAYSACMGDTTLLSRRPTPVPVPRLDSPLIPEQPFIAPPLAWIDDNPLLNEHPPFGPPIAGTDDNPHDVR
jgi:hypothetical protein